MFTTFLVYLAIGFLATPTAPSLGALVQVLIAACGSKQSYRYC